MDFRWSRGQLGDATGSGMGYIIHFTNDTAMGYTLGCDHDKLLICAR